MSASSNSTSKEIDSVEQALISQWANFGQSAGGSFHDDGEMIWTEAPVANLPYNAILQTRLREDAQATWDERVQTVMDRFDKKGVQFLWIVHPTASPADLEQRLISLGLSRIATETGMVLQDLASHYPPGEQSADPGPVTCSQVTDEIELEHFERLIIEYWGLPEELLPYVHEFTREAFAAGGRGEWFLARHEGKVVGKAYLSLRGPDDTASLWGVYVKPEARGMGIAGRLTSLALSRAAACGKERAALISTDLGFKVYQRLGFREVCRLPVYANTAVLSALQGIQPV